MIVPIEGMALDPKGEGALINEPYLILQVNKNLDFIVVIPVAARKSGGRTYFRAPRTLNYETVESQLNSTLEQRLVQKEFEPRNITTYTDADLDARFKRKGQTESAAARRINLRWKILEPLVSDDYGKALLDKNVRSIRVQKRAKELAEDSVYQALFKERLNRSIKPNPRKISNFERRVSWLTIEIVSLLFQFWAGGSNRGALIGFGENSGGRGQHRKAGAKKRGRKSAKDKENGSESTGLNITHDSDHEKIIRYAYDHYYIKNVSEAAACRQMWSEFYSVITTHADGQINNIWLPPEQRPTRAQFRYWGRQEGGDARAFKHHLASKQFEREYRPMFGSSRDDVFAVGQKGAMDSSPADIELVRAIDRTARVGKANRIFLVDSCFGYIPGFYMGFMPPCATTVKLAIYNAMDPDKGAWLEELGLDYPAEELLPISFAGILADNTDLRNLEVFECGRGIGTHIDYIPTYRPDLNWPVETTHHSIHSLADHDLSGTTYGRPKERGEDAASLRARLSLIEAIRETARAVHTHNTIELDVPIPLGLNKKDVPRTRLGLTRELIRQGKVARPMVSMQLARRHLLPRWAGTITGHGARLHQPGTGDKVIFLERVCWISQDPDFAWWMSMARRERNNYSDAYFRQEFIVNPYRLRKIWFVEPKTRKEIPLDAVALGFHDGDILQEFTIPDLQESTALSSAQRPSIADSRDRTLGELEEHHRRANAEAEKKYQAVIESSRKNPSKASMKENKHANRISEEEGCAYGIPINPQIPIHAEDNHQDLTSNVPVRRKQENATLLVQEGDDEDSPLLTALLHAENGTGGNKK